MTIHKDTLSFLTELEANNNKPWFDENRKRYDIVRKDFVVLVQKIIDEFAKIDRTIEGQEAKKTLFRINRDVRFSKDKTPYKPHFSAFISKGGKKFEGAGYYIRLKGEGQTFIGAGVWQPPSPVINSIRQEIDYNFQEFLDIIEDKKFKKSFSKIEGEALKTKPKGYELDNPAIEYLKKKSFFSSFQFDDKSVNSPDFYKNVIEKYQLIQPFVNFLNRNIV